MSTSNGQRTTYDITNFIIRDMISCGKIMRTIGAGAVTMEEVATRIVNFLFDSLVDESGKPACALVRLFKTHSYQGLAEELRLHAREMLGDTLPFPGMKCLNLLGSAGEQPSWNSRSSSKGHQSIPLPSEEAVHQIPMISNLIQQLGLDVCMVVKPDPQLMLDIEQKTFNVFHVTDALGSPYIPAQKEFVVPCGIKSVLGFGGLLPSGDIFAVIIFFKVPVARQTSELFTTLSLNLKLALLPFAHTVFK